MARSFNISIIGSGNVTYSLAPALETAGNRILEVYSRDLTKAKEITFSLYEAIPTSDFDFSESKSEIFLICVPDDAIRDISRKFKFPGHAIIAHTSGTVSIDALSGLKNKKGVFYPVQTFTRNRRLNMSEVPVVIESPSVETEKTLSELAVSITKNIFYLKSERRRILHIAAVFASNFVNNMIVSSKQILDKEQIPFGVLQSLIKETVEKALENDPRTVQTGPAIRGDLDTIKSHSEYLHKYPELLNIYRLVTENIINLR